jgi:hypothetical protein
MAADKMKLNLTSSSALPSSHSPSSSIFWSAARFNSDAIKVRRLPPSCVDHFRCAQVFSLSVPQTFFSQATGSERIVVKVCSGRRDVLASLLEVWIDEAERRTLFLFEATRTGR